MSDERLDFILKLVDQASKPAHGIVRSLDGIDKSLKVISGSDALGKMGRDAQKAGRALKDVNRADKFLQTAANLDLASNSLRRFSDAAGAAFLGPVREAATFERGMSRVKALTSDYTDQLEELARAQGRDTRYTAEQAAGGLSNLAMAGFSASEQTASLAHVLSLDTAGGMDNLSETAKIASRTLRGFGLEASETQRVADTLTRTFTNSNTTLAGLGETFSYVAPVARSVGVPLEEVAKAAGILGDAAIDSSRAGTALRLLMANLAGASPPATKAIKKLNIQTEDAAGNLRPFASVMLDIGKALGKLGSAKRLKAATDIFGMRGASAGLQLADQVSAAGASFQKMEGAMGNADITAARVAETMEDNLLGDVTKVESAISDLKIEIGKGFRPELRELAKIIQGDIIPAMKGWTTENEKTTKAGVGATGALAVIVGVGAGLATVGGVGAAIVGGLMKFWGGLMAVGRGLKWVVTLGGNLGKTFQFLRMMTTGLVGLLGDAVVAASATAAGAFAVLGAAIAGTALGVLTQWESVRDFFADWPAWFHELGASIAEGLIYGWRSIFGGWEDEIVNNMTGITKTIESVMGIHSPSKVMAGIGENMAAGLSEGFSGSRGGTAAIPSAAASMGGQMATGSRTMVFRPTIQLTVNGGDSDGASQQGIADSVQGALSRAFDEFRATMGG